MKWLDYAIAAILLIAIAIPIFLVWLLVTV